MTDRYQIPQHDEDPTEEMIEFLNANPEEWDGDPSGILLHHDDGTQEFGNHGDWVVRDANGRYSIEKGDCNAS